MPLNLPRWLSGKESACQAGDAGLIPGLGRSPGEGNWQLTPVFLPGKKSHGQRSLAGYSPRGHERAGPDLVTKQQQQRTDLKATRKFSGT